MRRGFSLLVGILVAGSLTLLAPAGAVPIAAADTQVLPKHFPEQGYPHRILGASSQYVLHDVHDYPRFGHDMFSVVRISDGATVWSGFDRSADAGNTPDAVGIAGSLYWEKIYNAQASLSAVRFFDVVTHASSGEIAVPVRETVIGVGAGWILTSRLNDDNVTNHLVLRRLNGTTADLTGVATSGPSYAGGDADVAYVRATSSTVVRVDVAAGTSTVVPRPANLTLWDGVVVGPTAVFNIRDNGANQSTVTAIDRTSGDVTVKDVDRNIAGNPTLLLLRGNGLGVYQNGSTPTTGVIRSVDLAAGTVGGVVASNVSDYRGTGNGGVALMISDTAPGSIALDSGSGPVKVTDLPPVAETTGTIAYDGTELRATWEDRTTWRIDPSAAAPAWTKTAWTDRQRVTTSGGVTLVNDRDVDGNQTNQWHLTWAGGSRDVTGWNLSLGHGGQLLVRDATSSGYVVERAKTGAVVATVPGDRRPVADGAWVWAWSAQKQLTGTNVDTSAVRVVPVVMDYSGSPIIEDVRGRFVMVSGNVYAVVDTLKQVATWNVPGVSPGTFGAFQVPRLGNGFVVWGRYTFTPGISGPTGTRLDVADLSAAHNSREVVDPVDGAIPSGITPDEAGSASFAYLDRSQQPKIARLPWLVTPPTVPDPPADTTAPTLGAATGSARFVPSGPVAYGWRATDASGIASYDVQLRSAANGGQLGGWTALRTGATSTSLQLPVAAGGERCFRFRATDKKGNVSAWSSVRCTAVGIEDKGLVRAGGATRVRNARALDGYVAKLGTSGSSVRSAGALTGRTLAVWFVTGPTQGKVAVFVAGNRVGTLSAAGAVGRRQVTLLLPRNGVVKLVRIGAKPVQVDAIAVAR